MLERLLPRHADNAYRGHRLALWLFAALLFLKSAMSLNSIFNGREEAVAADAIPLDAFTPAGAQTVVAMIAAWGLAQLTICLLCAAVLVRYRALVPFVFALLLFEHLGRRLLFLFVPLFRAGTPPGLYLNLALAALIVVGLVLSLRGRGVRQAA